MPKFYSTREGALCTRYGTGTYIGAMVVMNGGQPGLKFYPDEVVSISDAEMAMYSREYNGLVAEKSLVERTEEEFEAWCLKQAADEQAAFETAELKKSTAANAENPEK